MPTDTSEWRSLRLCGRPFRESTKSAGVAKLQRQTARGLLTSPSPQDLSIPILRVSLNPKPQAQFEVEGFKLGFCEFRVYLLAQWTS